MRRLLFREIRRNPGRFFAIMAIIALGVGFFAGLKVTETAMLKTGQDYLEEQKFYHFRLLSTLGLTQEDVDAFAQTDGVAAAEGTVSADVLVESKDGDTAMKLLSLPEQVDLPNLVSGRMPQAADECVVDALYHGGNDLGKPLHISDANTDETRALLRYEDYTVVGLVSSPLYVNYERGGTSIGSGTLSGFFYVPSEGLDYDAFTEVDVRLSRTADLYSEEYDALEDEFSPILTETLEQRAQTRYETLRADAEQTLADAKQELSDGETALAEAKQTLEQGEAEYAAAAEQLEQRRPYAALLGASFEEAERQLAETRRTLDEGQAQLAGQEQKLKEARAELANGERALSELKAPQTYVLGRSANVGYACFENDTGIVRGIANVFPLFFFLVAALVCITTMTRMIDEQRTQIGTLKALGYSDAAIMGNYLRYAVLASLVGCVAGFLAGSWIFPEILWRTYDIMYDFYRPIEFVLDWRLAVFSIAMYLFCALLATWSACKASLHEVAAELIRPKAPAPGKRIWLERIPFIWKRMPFLHKVSARNVFRYHKRLVMMVLGIGGCMALLLTGLGLHDSIQNIVDDQFDHISTYDMAVSFSEPPSQATLDALSDYDYTLLHESTVDISQDGRTKSTRFLVPSDNTDQFLTLRTEDGADVSMPSDGEVVLSTGLADDLGADVGDTVTLRSGDNREMMLTVSGLYVNYIYNYAIASAGSCQAQWGSVPEQKTAYLNAPAGSDLHRISAELSALDGVSRVTVNQDMRDRVNGFMSSMNDIVLLVLLCAAALAFIVLYNLTSINITERVREIATLKVLGFYPSETAAYVFRENVVLTLIGAAAGVPMGIALHRYVMAQINIDMITFHVRIAWQSYLYALALCLLFALTVDVLLRFRLRRIDMTESMKAAE